MPAAVLVAPWTSHSTWADGMMRHMLRDPVGTFLVGVTLSTSPFIRSPKWAASMLISEQATIAPEELHTKLVEESALVLNQHNPPFWRPLKSPSTPMLWLAAGKDAVVSPKGSERSAAFYGAEFHKIDDAGHNLMMEPQSKEIALLIDGWLSGLD